MTNPCYSIFLMVEIKKKEKRFIVFIVNCLPFVFLIKNCCLISEEEEGKKSGNRHTRTCSYIHMNAVEVLKDMKMTKSLVDHRENL